MAVRVWPASDYSRVTIESDQALLARQFFTDSPPRLVIDIDGLELSPALRELVGKVRADDPFIAGVRVGQNQPRVVRLVIDLKQAVAPQQFTLLPVAAYQHRLVFDLYPTEARDPLLDLIRERERASEQAARSVQDALGEFIGRIEPTGPALASSGPLLAQRPGPPAIPASGAALPPQSTPAPPQPAPPPTGNLAFTTWGTDAELAGLRQGIARFEAANTGAKIALNAVPYGQMFTNIDAQLQAGNPPDVFRVLSRFSTGSPKRYVTMAEAAKALDALTPRSGKRPTWWQLLFGSAAGER